VVDLVAAHVSWHHQDFDLKILNLLVAIIFYPQFKLKLYVYCIFYQLSFCILLKIKKLDCRLHSEVLRWYVHLNLHEVLKIGLRYILVFFQMIEMRNLDTN